MKKVFAHILIIIAFLISSTAIAAKREVSDRQEKAAVLTKVSEIKPTKQDKKRAKQLKKDGWVASIDETEIELQLVKYRLIAEELMHDEYLDFTHRYILGSGRATAGSYSAAKSIARTKAQNEIASKIETSLATGAKNITDSSQSDALLSITTDKYHEQIQTLIRNRLTNTETAMCMYRELSNHNFEVEITIFYDKKELLKILKDAMRNNLEEEGQEFFNKIEHAIMIDSDK